MIETEKREILCMLHESSEALRAAVAGIDEADAARRPATDRWSVLECVEHLAITETALFGLVEAATETDTARPNPAREEKILARALDRTRFIAAPEPAIPPGRVPDLQTAVFRFEAARARTVRFVEQFQGDLRAWLTTHPMVRGPVNLYEMLLMIGLHPKRHAEQIRETLAVLAAQRS